MSQALITRRLNTRSLHVGFVVDEVALGWVFLPLLWPSSVSIIPSMLHTVSSRSYVIDGSQIGDVN